MHYMHIYININICDSQYMETCKYQQNTSQIQEQKQLAQNQVLSTTKQAQTSIWEDLDNSVQENTTWLIQQNVDNIQKISSEYQLEHSREAVKQISLYMQKLNFAPDNVLLYFSPVLQHMQSLILSVADNEEIEESFKDINNEKNSISTTSNISEDLDIEDDTMNWSDEDNTMDWIQDSDEISKIHKQGSTPQSNIPTKNARFQNGAWVSEEQDEDTLELLSIEDFTPPGATTTTNNNNNNNISNNISNKNNTKDDSNNKVKSSNTHIVNSSINPKIENEALKDIDSFLDMNDEDDDKVVIEKTPIGILNSIPSETNIIDPKYLVYNTIKDISTTNNEQEIYPDTLYDLSFDDNDDNSDNDNDIIDDNNSNISEISHVNNSTMINSISLSTEKTGANRELNEFYISEDLQQVWLYSERQHSSIFSNLAKDIDIPDESKEYFSSIYTFPELHSINNLHTQARIYSEWIHYIADVFDTFRNTQSSFDKSNDSYSTYSQSDCESTS